MARLSALKKVQRKFAKVLITSTATVCSGIAATANSCSRCDSHNKCANSYDCWDSLHFWKRTNKKKRLGSFDPALGVNVGASFAIREGARAIAELFPGAGNAVSASIAFAGTWGIGVAAMAYFIDGATIEEVKFQFEEGKKEYNGKKQLANN